MFESGQSRGVVSVEEMAAVWREQVRAEYRTIETMLRMEDQGIEAAQYEVTPFARYLGRSTFAGDIADATDLSENQVFNRVYPARTVRDRAPLVWQAFAAGEVDFARINEIYSTIEKLQEPESVAQLDHEVVAYIPGHTCAELRRWLRRFVVRVETDAALARAEAEREKRHVTIEHGDDGMSRLNAYLPSHMAAAIERRLHKAARALEKDDRTIPQREADLLVSWATNSEATEPQVDASIAVVVDADVLSGCRRGFASSPDHDWFVPAEWIAEFAQTQNPFWYRMVVDPVTKDVLTIDYKGRFAPKVLRQALEFKHGTCVIKRCLVPAWKCEIDHEIPWPRGRTTGSNLTPKSKRHHAQKGHGLLPAHSGAA